MPPGRLDQWITPARLVTLSVNEDPTASRRICAAIGSATLAKSPVLLVGRKVDHTRLLRAPILMTSAALVPATIAVASSFTSMRVIIPPPLATVVMLLPSENIKLLALIDPFTDSVASRFVVPIDMMLSGLASAKMLMPVDERLFATAATLAFSACSA